ncbi:hypothetical protein ElyMa_004037000 [Elysia marginata]|uniref:Pleiotrophin/Midkine C-terminal domain-containing protein n=1 Tax=Elysia marginata TaxID=1093978 RepID=A0AAV4G3L1_9GAST|nr:hypothetical protein ElyMa_004037000 [Elysia marginata]
MTADKRRCKRNQIAEKWHCKKGQAAKKRPCEKGQAAIKKSLQKRPDCRKSPCDKGQTAESRHCEIHASRAELHSQRQTGHSVFISNKAACFHEYSLTVK